MMRSACVVLVALASIAPAARADDGDSLLGERQVRFLSLDEARATAVEGLSEVFVVPFLGFPAPGVCFYDMVSKDVEKPWGAVRVFVQLGSSGKQYVLTHSKGKAYDFQREVNQKLLNIETAYWNLYGSYWNLHSREQALRLADKTWRIVRCECEAGSKTVAHLDQTYEQYKLFRAQRSQALDTVLDNECQLRALMGLPLEDGTRLVPCDAPSVAAYKPDWKTSLQEALARRPEVIVARREVKVDQLNLKLAKNALLPDLRFTANYDTTGIGEQLDSSPSTNALRQLASNPFNDWVLGGLRLNMPIGFQAAHANVRIAKLQLARSSAVLKDQELKTERFLGLQYRRLASYHEQIRAQRAQREAYEEQLKARCQDYVAEQKSLDILLEAQRFWADALANEYAAVASYNNARCCFAYAKGMILDHAHITLTDSPPADSCRVRAVTCEPDRTHGRILAAKPVPTCSLLNAPLPDRLEGPCSIPALWKSIPPLKYVAAGSPTALQPEEVFPAAAATE